MAPSMSASLANEPTRHPPTIIFGKSNSNMVEGSTSSMYDMSHASVVLSLTIPTAKPLFQGISRYIYTGRETFCDIMCTTNTSKAYTVPTVKDPKIKDVVATLPYSKKMSFSSLGKGETPWQKLKFDEARILRNDMLKMERNEFLAKLQSDRKALEQIEQEELALLEQTAEYNNSKNEKAVENYMTGMLYVKHSLRPVMARKLTLSKEDERRMFREVMDIQDELCALATKLKLKPIRGLTLEPRGKASRRKRQVENAAARRLQRWCKMLIAKHIAKERCQAVRDIKRNKAANIIQIMFKNVGMKHFLESLERGNKNDAAKVTYPCPYSPMHSTFLPCTPLSRHRITRCKLTKPFPPPPPPKYTTTKSRSFNAPAANSWPHKRCGS